MEFDSADEHSSNVSVDNDSSTCDADEELSPAHAEVLVQTVALALAKVIVSESYIDGSTTESEYLEDIMTVFLTFKSEFGKCDISVRVDISSANNRRYTTSIAAAFVLEHTQEYTNYKEMVKSSKGKIGNDVPRSSVRAHLACWDMLFSASEARGNTD